MDTRRTPIIAGNWKMNTTVAEARALATALRGSLAGLSGVTVVLCPPFISLAAVAEVAKGTSLQVGAQNMYTQPKGAFTGEIAPTMLQGVCSHVILGHSERRGYFGETDELVNAKVKAALAHGLRPIVCVGETLRENEAGQTEQVLARQARGALQGLNDLSTVAVAYEPVWAIGTGKAASGPGANQSVRAIRHAIAEVHGADAASRVPVLYGGSVTPQNVAEFLGQPEIDGALVGGASLKAEDFAAIVQTAVTMAARH